MTNLVKVSLAFGALITINYAVHQYSVGEPAQRLVFLNTQMLVLGCYLIVCGWSPLQMLISWSMAGMSLTALHCMQPPSALPERGDVSWQYMTQDGCVFSFTLPFLTLAIFAAIGVSSRMRLSDYSKPNLKTKISDLILLIGLFAVCLASVFSSQLVSINFLQKWLKLFLSGELFWRCLFVGAYDFLLFFMFTAIASRYLLLGISTALAASLLKIYISSFLGTSFELTTTLTFFLVEFSAVTVAAYMAVRKFGDGDAGQVV